MLELTSWLLKEHLLQPTWFQMNLIHQFLLLQKTSSNPFWSNGHLVKYTSTFKIHMKLSLWMLRHSEIVNVKWSTLFSEDYWRQLPTDRRDQEALGDLDCSKITDNPSMLKMCAQSLSCVWIFVDPWTVTCQAPLPMAFSRQEY